MLKLAYSQGKNQISNKQTTSLIESLIKPVLKAILISEKNEKKLLNCRLLQMVCIV